MRALPQEKLDPKAVTVWRIKGIFASLIFSVFVVLYVIISELDVIPAPPTWVYLLLSIMIILYAVYKIFLIPSLRLRFWRYEVTEEEIDLYRGIFIRTRTIIPMSRVQHVDTQEGPLFRHYRLATVLISTAATQHEIPALSYEIADELRDSISQFAMVVEDDV